MEQLELTAKIAILALLWVLLASPVLGAGFLIAQTLKRRRLNSWPIVLVLSLLVAFAVAPVPTPIITVFMPNIYAFFDASYYPRIFSGDSFYHPLLNWAVASFFITSLLVGAVAKRYLTTGVPRA